MLVKALVESWNMVWLLDCRYVHKGCDFLDWLKETHPNNFMIFIPTNCTSVLQLIDVIL